MEDPPLMPMHKPAPPQMLRRPQMRMHTQGVILMRSQAPVQMQTLEDMEYQEVTVVQVVATAAMAVMVATVSTCSREWATSRKVRRRAVR